MASASIRRRETKGGHRFQVRYRLGGRGYPVVHGGSFPRLKEARLRRDLIAGELAAGRNPAETLRTLASTPQRRTFAQVAEAYSTSRIDLAASTRVLLANHLKAILPSFGERDPSAITVADVQEWVGSLQLKPSSVRSYLGTLRAVLDHAGLEPNPARDDRLHLPRVAYETVEPPSAEQVEAILDQSAPRWRLPLRTLEQTGLRVGELTALEWRDVDLAESRFRVREGKTVAARRWVAVPVWLMYEIADTTPPDDRTAERRVFQGFNSESARMAMARACRAAGIPHYSPHDLRHRYASVKVAEGVPITDLAAQLGHSRKSMTLDTYSHVLLGN
jgi:integrase